MQFKNFSILAISTILIGLSSAQGADLNVNHSLLGSAQSQAKTIFSNFVDRMGADTANDFNNQQITAYNARILNSMNATIGADEGCVVEAKDLRSTYREIEKDTIVDMVKAAKLDKESDKVNSDKTIGKDGYPVTGWYAEKLKATLEPGSVTTNKYMDKIQNMREKLNTLAECKGIKPPKLIQ